MSLLLSSIYEIVFSIFTVSSIELIFGISILSPKFVMLLLLLYVSSVLTMSSIELKLVLLSELHFTIRQCFLWYHLNIVVPGHWTFYPIKHLHYDL